MKYLNFYFRGRRKKFVVAAILLSSSLVLPRAEAADDVPAQAETARKACMVMVATVQGSGAYKRYVSDKCQLTYFEELKGNGQQKKDLSKECAAFTQNVDAYISEIPKAPKEKQEELKKNAESRRDRIKVLCGAPKKGVVEAGEVRILEVGPEERSSGAAN
ncbi:hypothetical protein K2X30_13410 [bacterium]|nr:hypothetical protein [bacterium]